MTRRIGGLVAAAVIAAGLLGTAQLTLARFHDADSVSASFGTRTLQPPTDLTGTGGATVGLAWTPSTSGWASGYEVLRSATSGSGYSAVATVTPITAAATTDNPAAGTWFYVLRSTFQNWQSVRSNEASVVVGSVPTTTGNTMCANQAADTGGDNDGYERNAGNACAQDGLVAQDRSSGTNTSNLCLNAGKDRHRFWGYGFGLPATVTSIDGITVRARMGSNNAMGIFGACVQLSWDGGASWTTHQPITFSSDNMTTYVFGGPTDTWGRTWTTGQLNTTNFRVRLIDVATVTNRRFDLDWIGVELDYTP